MNETHSPEFFSLFFRVALKKSVLYEGKKKERHFSTSPTLEICCYYELLSLRLNQSLDMKDRIKELL